MCSDVIPILFRRTRNFCAWLIPTILLPLSPIGVEYFVLNTFQGKYAFPNQRVLTFCLVFPLIALKDAQDAESKYILVGFSLFGVLLFALSIVAESVLKQPRKAEYLYSVGFWLLLFLIVLAVIIKLVRLCKGIEE